MDLGTFREITKNLSDDTILYMSLAEVVKGDVIELYKCQYNTY